MAVQSRGRVGLRWWVLGWFVVAAAAVAPAPEARAVTLRWKFKPGQTLRYTMDQKSVTTAKLPGGQEIKSTLSQSIEMTWAVKSVDESGRAELTQTINRIRDQVEAPVGSYTFDSKETKEPEGLIAAARVPLFKALVDAPIAFTMNPQGEPADVRLPEKVAQTLRDLGPAGAGGGALFSEDGIREMIAQASLVVPTTDLTEGKTWSRQTKNAAPIGTVIVDSTYRFDGAAAGGPRDVVRIVQTTKLEVQPPAEAAGNASPAGPKIRSQKSQGTYTFDNGAGHLVDASASEQMEVGFTVKVGLGTAAKDMELTQTSETTTTRKLVK
jgi:hypothetical protein